MVKDITINLDIDFNKLPFNSRPNNSLKEYAEKFRRENNKPEYLEKSSGEVLHQVVGYEKY